MDTEKPPRQLNHWLSENSSPTCLVRKIIEPVPRRPAYIKVNGERDPSWIHATSGALDILDNRYPGRWLYHEEHARRQQMTTKKRNVFRAAWLHSFFWQTIHPIHQIMSPLIEGRWGFHDWSPTIISQLTISSLTLGLPPCDRSCLLPCGSQVDSGCGDLSEPFLWYLQRLSTKYQMIKNLVMLLNIPEDAGELTRDLSDLILDIRLPRSGILNFPEIMSPLV